MKILAIESSCDEFAVAVVEDGRRILAQKIHSQIDLHQAFGGVVPEVAARSHLEVAIPTVAACMQDFTWDEIDAIAVTSHPGLIGSLMMGNLTARVLAKVKRKPLIEVEHIAGHVYANWLVDGAKGRLPQFVPSEPTVLATPVAKADTHKLQQPPLPPQFPVLALVVSGGHTQIMLWRSHHDYEVVGCTQDDAAGEAFDKVAKIIGLPYPGGPSIAAAAERGDPAKYPLPKPKLANPYDFSFSGLKTAVLRAVQAAVGVDYTFPSFQLAERLTPQQRDDFAVSFQATAAQVLSDKLLLAYQEFQPQTVMIAGGVAANQKLRQVLAERLPIEITYAPAELCTDNAAMIGARAYWQTRG